MAIEINWFGNEPTTEVVEILTELEDYLENAFDKNKINELLKHHNNENLDDVICKHLSNETGLVLKRDHRVHPGTRFNCDFKAFISKVNVDIICEIEKQGNRLDLDIIKLTTYACDNNHKMKVVGLLIIPSDIKILDRFVTGRPNELASHYLQRLLKLSEPLCNKVFYGFAVIAFKTKTNKE